MLQYIINGIMLGSTYALIGIAMCLLFGLLKMENMAHGEVVMVGGLGVYIFTAEYDFPLYLVFPLTIIAGITLALLTKIVSFDLVKKEFPTSNLVSTLALSIMVPHVLVLFVGSDPLSLPKTLPKFDLFVGGVMVSGVQIIILAVAVIAVSSLLWAIKKTGWGRAVRAIGQDRRAAELIGISITRNIVIAIIIVSVLGAITGSLYAIRLSYITVFIGSPLLLKGIAVMIVGGMSRLEAAIYSGLLLGVLESLAIIYVPGTYADSIIWIILILVLLFKPEGLFAKKTIAKRV